MVKRWKKKEDTDAKLFDAKQTPRSGGLWFAKGDSKSKTFLIENKTSVHDRFSITQKVWQKIEHEALLIKRIPLLSIAFGKENTELVVLDKNDFLQLMHDTKN